MGVSLQQVLTLSAVLFAGGLYVVLTRPNAIAILMGVELILNAVNINFVAFERYVHHGISGTLAALITIVLAAAEVAVALAIVISVFKSIGTIEIDETNELKG